MSAIARAYGIKVTTSTATFAGQPATCISATVRGKSGKYCVTNQGILAYVGSNGSSVFKMTKYSSKPSASLFKLPAGATIHDHPRAAAPSRRPHVPERWQGSSVPRGAAYDKRFDDLASAGMDVHGEATLVDSYGPACGPRRRLRDRPRRHRAQPPRP